MELITQAEFSRRKGVSQTAVYNAIKSGRLKKSVSGEKPVKIDWDMGQKEWSANRNEGFLRNAKPEYIARELDKSEVTKDSTPTADEFNIGGASEPEEVIPHYQASRAKREHWAARLAELEALKEEGKLVTVESVKAEAFQVAQIVKMAILGIPSKIGPELAAEVDPWRVEKMLDRELRQALEELSHGKFMQD